MRYLFTIYFIFISSICLFSQNLVPNHSFEDYSQCPDDQGQIENSIGWFDGLDWGTDYYNSCSTDIFSSIPFNSAGFQYPHTGNAYVGFGVFLDNGVLIENIQNSLISPLVSNKKYCIEYFVSLSEESSYYINSLGTYFSANPLPNNVSILSVYTPQFVNAVSQLNDTSAWIKVSGEYVANGGEKFITIGNFNPISNIDTIFVGYPPGTTQKKCYFYIEDVSVICCEPAGCDEIIISNIFTPNSDGVNDVFQIESLPANSKLYIYNRWGVEVYQSNNYKNNWSGDNLSDGVYYYILTLPTGNSTKGMVTILRD
jgi:OOP family OmpA-OmpF porin